MSEDRRPNILVLFSDQHRYDALGCNRESLGAAAAAQGPHTPHMDSIAQTGMRFTHAFTPVALCSPARGSVLTGLYPHNHGLLANMGNFNGVFDKQLLDKTGYPEHLSGCGYRVSHVGKWHMPGEGDKAFWHFDQWHTESDYGRYVAEAGYQGNRALEVQRLEWGATAPFCGRSVIPAEHLQEAWVADRTVDLLETYAGGADATGAADAAREEPFMIFSSFFGPHFPYAVPAPYDTMYDPAQVKRWNNFDDQFVNKPLIQQKEMLRWNASHLTWPDWQRVIATYWGYCSYIDDQIGRVLRRLEKLGLAENTIVIYAADHGDMLGSHRLFNKGFQMYDEIYHVPLLVRWPGVTQAGARCDEFVNLVDFAPTFLEVAGAQRPESLDGRSLAPLLRGETVEDWPDDVFAEFHGYESALCTQRMVRTRSWKYIYNPCAEDELYDIASDPGELWNLAGQLGYKHVLRRMKDRLVAWLDRSGDTIGEDDGWKGSPYDLYLSARER